MRVRICAVGRLRGGPEADLIQDYLNRFKKTARGLGWGDAEVIEIEDRKGGGKTAEAVLLKKAIPASAVVICLDERGKTLTSPAFADRLRGWADQGRSDLAVLIGGADGLGSDLVDRADLVLSFGRMVWPHMLARVMLAEQLYRAATILTGGPYHRV